MDGFHQLFLPNPDVGLNIVDAKENIENGSFDFHDIVQQKLNNGNINDDLKRRILTTKMHPPERCANRGFNIKRLDSEELQFVAYSEVDDGFYCKSCVLFSFREGRFVSRPFCFFKAFFSAGNGWPKHSKSKYHKDATRTTLNFIQPNSINGSEELTDFLTTYAKALVNLENQDTSNEKGTGHQRSPSRGSSVSNNEPQNFELPAFAAYRIRQTYIFMRVLGTNKPVLCKANDEDFFPAHRTHTTPAERANWTAGQIVTAYFDFDQKETECAIELIGDREEVQEYFQEVIIQEALNRKNSDVSNENQNGLSSTVRKLIFPDIKSKGEIKQNGHTVDMEEPDNIWETSNGDSAIPPPSKLPRLDPNILSNDIIVKRFETLENRIRLIEQQQQFQLPKVDDSIDILIDDDRVQLKNISIDVLRNEIVKNRKQIMNSDSLNVNNQNLYEKFRELDFSDEFCSSAPEFGSKVLALLISSETFHNYYIPSLTEGQTRNGTIEHQNQSLSSEIIEVYKKLLLFLGGSVICPENYKNWLNEIHENIHEFEFNGNGFEPIYTTEMILDTSS